ncbi:hypothetical protein F5Y02DRAFT_423408 [Annulohypoxylon stygium]|nr:hypothetical protein F5Y02DRAFT_423408 [Annulohypoxylon stygium]
MAPESIQEARRDYALMKRDTAIFKTWLENTARSCGWKSSDATNARGTFEIVEQIRLVSESQSDEYLMLEKVYISLCKAIEGRKQCNEFFSSARLGTEDTSTKHTHFIEILENAAITLPRRHHMHLAPIHMGIQSVPNNPAATIQPPALDDPEEGWTVVQRKGRKSRSKANNYTQVNSTGTTGIW